MKGLKGRIREESEPSRATGWDAGTWSIPRIDLCCYGNGWDARGGSYSVARVVAPGYQLSLSTPFPNFTPIPHLHLCSGEWQCVILHEWISKLLCVIYSSFTRINTNFTVLNRTRNPVKKISWESWFRGGLKAPSKFGLNRVIVYIAEFGLLGCDAVCFLDRYNRFEGACWFHFQGREPSQIGKNNTWYSDWRTWTSEGS